MAASTGWGVLDLNFAKPEGWPRHPSRRHPGCRRTQSQGPSWPHSARGRLPLPQTRSGQLFSRWYSLRRSWPAASHVVGAATAPSTAAADGAGRLGPPAFWHSRRRPRRRWCPFGSDAFKALDHAPSCRRALASLQDAFDQPSGDRMENILFLAESGMGSHVDAQVPARPCPALYQPPLRVTLPRLDFPFLL